MQKIVYRKINQWNPQEVVEGFVYVKEANYRITNAGKPYIDFTFSDSTGEVNAKLWDANEEIRDRYKVDQVLKIRGIMNLFQGRPQVKLERIRLITEEDGVDINDFILSAPYPADEMLDLLKSYIAKIGNGDIRKITEEIVKANREKLLYYPAAQKNHHAIRAGLLYHTTTMLKLAESISAVYPSLNTDLLYAGVILHDMQKTGEMDSNELGVVCDYTKEGQLLGHIVMGVVEIGKTGEMLKADPEIVLVLQHMVLAHHSEPDFGSPKRPMIPEAEILHYIDNIDAKMYDMSKALEKTDEKGFSDKIWSMDNRKIYKAEI